MDQITREFWQKAIHELEHLNRNLNSLLRLLHRPEEDNANSIKKVDESHKRNDYSGGKVLLATNLQPSAEHRHNKNKSWYKTFSGWKNALELLAFIAAPIYAVITYNLWSDAHRGFEDQRHNFEIDERSWVKVGISWPVIRPNAMNEPSAHFVNIGKSTITRLYARTFLELDQSTQEPSFNYSQKRVTQDLAPLFPGDSSDLKISYFDPGTGIQRPLNSQEIDDLIAGKKYLVSFGVVIYNDQFGPHWSKYCSYTGQPNVSFQSGICVPYNEVGDGDISYEKLQKRPTTNDK